MIASIQHDQRRDRNKGMIFTIVFHTLLAILFLFIGLSTWDPPLPEEMVEVAMADYGTTDDGGGNTPKPDPGAQLSTPVSAPDNPEDVATDEASEVEVVKPPVPKPPKPNTKPNPKPEKPKEPTIDNRLNEAINNWNKPGSQPADGPDTKPGDPGVETGKPGGIGTKGEGWELIGSNRGLARGPDLSERPELQNATWVEVTVIVNRDGRIVRELGVTNAATSDSHIHAVAIRAVKNCLFVKNPNGPPEQKLSIRLRFFPG